MPAVFVHGVPDTWRVWNAIIDESGRDDVVALALPGFGAPLPDGFVPTKESYAGWITARIEALGEPVDLVGHDWGSLLVQRVASTRPDLIRTWAAGGGPVDEQYVWHDIAQRWQTPGTGEDVMAATTPETMAVALESQLGHDAAVEMAAHVDDTMKSCILSLYRSAVTVGAEWQPAVDALGAARPALVLWGRDDVYAPPEFGRRLAQRVGATFVPLDGGHFSRAAADGGRASAGRVVAVGLTSTSTRR
jgi:pimeloyl-ACP methyl ester carboxylesterase